MTSPHDVTAGDAMSNTTARAHGNFLDLPLLLHLLPHHRLLCIHLRLLAEQLLRLCPSRWHRLAQLLSPQLVILHCGDDARRGTLDVLYLNTTLSSRPRKWSTLTVSGVYGSG